MEKEKGRRGKPATMLRVLEDGLLEKGQGCLWKAVEGKMEAPGAVLW